MATTPQTLSHPTAGGIDKSHRRVIFADRKSVV